MNQQWHDDHARHVLNDVTSSKTILRSVTFLIVPPSCQNVKIFYPDRFRPELRHITIHADEGQRFARQ